MANASPLLYACLLFSLVLFAAGADIQEKINPANPPIVNANTTANSSSLEATSGANTQEKNKTDVVVVNSQTNSTNGTQLVASPRLDETNKPNSGNQSANSTTKNDDEKQLKSGADQKLDVKNGSVIVTNGTNVARDANATEAVTQLSPPLSSGSNETLSKTSNQTNQVLTNQTQPVLNQTAVVVGSNNTSNQTNNQTKVEEQKPAGEEKEKEKEAEKEKEKEAEVNSDPKKPDEKTSDKPTSSATGNEEFPPPEIEGKEEEKGNEKGEKEEEKGEERGNEKEEEKNENENNPDENDKLNETYTDNEAQENKNNNNNNQKEAQQQQQPKLPDSGSYQNNNRNPGKMPSDSFDDDESSSTSFLTYFLILSTLCVVLYVSYHNRSKIMGLIVEGPSGSKRRVIDSRVYNRLENVRDAMPNA